MRLLLIAAMACALAAPCHADQPKSKSKRQVAPQPPVPVALPVVLRPDQMPSQPPQVTFRDGQLSITAQNSTLGDILRAVRNQTGASVEVPGNATERVVGQFGPGPPRDVLATLLNGTHFNYVLLGSVTNPDALDRVLLTTKTGDNGQNQQPAMAADASQQPVVPAPAVGDGGEMAVDDQDQQGESTDLFAEDPNAPPDDQTNNPFGQPAVRTPQQMLQDLQMQQQVQQQIQQQQQQMQNNPNPNPIPPFRGVLNPRGQAPPQPNPQ